MSQFHPSIINLENYISLFYEHQIIKYALLHNNAYLAKIQIAVLVYFLRLDTIYTYITSDKY